jgi:hypothetical protein
MLLVHDSFVACEMRIPLVFGELDKVSTSTYSKEGEHSILLRKTEAYFFHSTFFELLSQI